MATISEPGAAAWTPGDLIGQQTVMGRFHIATLVMRRTKQLQGGARPRAQANEHKLFRLALIEILSGAISWSVLSETLPSHDPS